MPLSHGGYRTLGLPPRPPSVSPPPSTNLLERRQRDKMMISGSHSGSARRYSTSSPSGPRRASFSGANLGGRSPSPLRSAQLGEGLGLGLNLGLTNVPQTLSASVAHIVTRSSTPVAHFSHPSTASGAAAYPPVSHRVPLTAPLAFPSPSRPQPIPSPADIRARDSSPFAGIGSRAGDHSAAFLDSDGDDNGYMTHRSASGRASRRGRHGQFLSTSSEESFGSIGSLDFDESEGRNPLVRLHNRRQAQGRREEAVPMIMPSYGDGELKPFERERLYDGEGLDGETKQMLLKRRRRGALLTERAGIVHGFSPDLRKSPATPGVTSIHAFSSPPSSPENYRQLPQLAPSPAPTATPSLSSASASTAASLSPESSQPTMRFNRRASLPATAPGVIQTSYQSYSRRHHSLLGASEQDSNPPSSSRPGAFRTRSSTVAVGMSGFGGIQGRGGGSIIPTDELATLRMSEAEQIRHQTQRRWSRGAHEGSIVQPFVLVVTFKYPDGHPCSRSCRQSVMRLSKHQSSPRSALGFPTPQVKIDTHSHKHLPPEVTLEWTTGYSDSFDPSGMSEGEIVDKIRRLQA